jgi:hypothetical protein
MSNPQPPQKQYLLRGIYSITTCQIQTGWSSCSERLFERWNGSIRSETVGNLNFGVSQNRFCDFLADPEKRSFSRFHYYSPE